MNSSAVRTLPALIGPALAVALTTASLAAAVWTPLPFLPEIQRACARVGIEQSACTPGAISAGVQTLLAFSIAMAAAIWVAMRPSRKTLSIPTTPAAVLLAGCFAVILGHMVMREVGPAYASRIEELRQFSSFMSLENLMWPLLVQMLLIEEDWRIRSAIITALLSILTLTIFRTAILTILLFAFVAPLVASLWQSRGKGWNASIRGEVPRLMVTLVVCGAMAWSAVADTQSRTLDSRAAMPGRPAAALTPGEGWTVPQPLPIPKIAPGALTTLGHVKQRLAFPLYQAGIVADLSGKVELPGIVDELLRKFRLSSRPNLNQYVYSLVEGMSGGETTSLYYGEGHAYFGKMAAAWVLLAPLCFVLAWYALRRVGIEAGALLGIQLWRSSFSGLVTMLPSVIMQTAMLALLCKSGRLRALDRWRGAVLAVLGLLLLGVTASLAVGLAQINDRKAVAEVTFATRCYFDPGRANAFAGEVDKALGNTGLNVRSVVLEYLQMRVVVLVPGGKSVAERSGAIAKAASGAVRCDRGTPAAVVENIRVLPSSGFVPLHGVAIISAIMSMVLLAGRLKSLAPSTAAAE